MPNNTKNLSVDIVEADIIYRALEKWQRDPLTDPDDKPSLDDLFAKLEVLKQAWQ